MNTKQNILNVYKNMIRTCKLLKEPQRTEAINDVRKEFRVNISETNPERLVYFYFHEGYIQ